MEFRAEMRYLRVSPQKARLVLELIKGRRVEENLDVEIDNLYVKSAIANEGPRMKRIRPAPQGRAYRYQRRISHIELILAERGVSGEAGPRHAGSARSA